MTDTKISAEVTKTPLTGNEFVRLADAGANWKATLNNAVAVSGLLRANNLSDLGSAATARTSLGLGALATLATVDAPQLAPTIYASTAEAQAGTEATKIITAARAKEAALAAVGNSLVGISQIIRNTDYTFVLADAGYHVLHPAADTTARTFTIPANSSVPFVIGTTLTFVNQNGAGAITIACALDTLRWTGSGTTGSRILAPCGMASTLKITATEWMISGIGLS
jgi:hypothetical protein